MVVNILNRNVTNSVFEVFGSNGTIFSVSDDLIVFPIILIVFPMIFIVFPIILIVFPGKDLSRALWTDPPASRLMPGVPR